MNNSWITPDDQVGSSFLMKITMTNDKVLTGYSKRQNIPEVKNRTNLIINWICRIERCGYFIIKDPRKGSLLHLEMFVKNPNGTLEKYFTMHRSTMEWHQDKRTKTIEKFFEDFYRILNKGGRPHEHLVITTKSQPTETLSLTAKRFTNKVLLREFCLTLKSQNSYEIGIIKDWYIKYCNLYLGGYDDTDEEFFSKFNDPII